jgi:hypothetical protein
LQEMKLVAVVDPGAGLGGGGVGLGATGLFGGIFALVEGEDGVFQGAGAVEAPAVLGDGLSEIELESAGGGEGFADAIAVLRESLLVFRGLKDDLASEAVAEGVEGGTLFAFGGTRTGGMLGVFAACIEFRFSHKSLLNPRPHGRG